jgi:hypothetical protein
MNMDRLFGVCEVHDSRVGHRRYTDKILAAYGTDYCLLHTHRGAFTAVGSLVIRAEELANAAPNDEPT